MRLLSRSRLAAAAAALCMLFIPGLAASRTAVPVAHWQVVLAAGDDAETVFDNATRALAGRLAAAGVPAGHIHRLSASQEQLRGPVEPASARVLLQRIADLSPQPGDRCLVFLTSHGERGAGLWLARSQQALSPDRLARALSRGCAAVPTVVIVSGCYTGGFADGVMTRPNRIILTAARADRPSFGCQVQRVYNYFDECLLAALPKSPTWQVVFDTTRACVRDKERRLGERPSEPQASFGRAVATLSIGF